MKSLLLASMLLLTQAASANSACNVLDAQIDATVSSVEAISQTKCRIIFNWSQSSYNPSPFCPLNIDEVTAFGVETTYCDYKSGDAISGTVFRPANASPSEIFFF